MDTQLSSSALKEDGHKFKFPSVKVYILDTVAESRENLKWVKLELTRYFEVFTSAKLTGVMFQDLADLIEQNMDLLLDESEEVPS